MAENGAESTYVVQRLTPDSDADLWRDVARVKVPPRTKRKTILEKALGEHPMAGFYRVLDEESGRDMEVSLEEQPPRVKIG
jgi:prephenate dehydrogenase